MMDVYSNKILIIGAGTSALIQAKTLLDDGFRAVSVVTSADRVGGVWARGPHGGIYPSLLTNSAWGNFEYSTSPMPRDDLTETDGRIKAETVSDYLQDFFETYLEGRLDIRCAVTPSRLCLPALAAYNDATPGLPAVSCKRSSGSTDQQLAEDGLCGPGTSRPMSRARRNGTESFSRKACVLSVPDPASLPPANRLLLRLLQPHSNPNFPEPLRGKTGFSGLFVHSSEVHDYVDRQILATKGRIVVIGCGKVQSRLFAAETARG